MNVREWALPVYTILMQLATGALFVLWLIRSYSRKSVDLANIDKILRKPVIVIFFTYLIATIGSHFHLSNPMLSFLAILNVGSSWLSREVVLTILTILSCAALIDQLLKRETAARKLTTSLGWLTIFLGTASIYCMASIYRLPTQSQWNSWTTILNFFGSALLIGITSATALLVMDAIFTQKYEPDLANDRLSILRLSAGPLTRLAIATMLLIIVLNATQILANNSGDKLAQISLALLLDLYSPLLWIRFIALIAGVGLLFLSMVRLQKPGKPLAELITPVYLACLLVLIAEILGRFLFYASHIRLGI